MKHRLGRFGAIFLALTLCLSLTGAGFAAWTDTVTINGTVTTGELCLEITACSLIDEIPSPPYYEGQPPLCDYTCNPGFTPDPVTGLQFWHSDKNVGWGEQVLVDSDGDGYKDTLNVTLWNTYPCYFNSLSFYVHNCGTVPVIIQKVIITVNSVEYEYDYNYFYAALDLSNNGNDDFEIYWGDHIGSQIEPCETPEISFWMHVLQDEDPAFQNGSFSFSIQVVGIQWNEYSP